MLRKFMIAAAMGLTLSGAAFAAEGGTAEEARAMLDKAIAAVKADKNKALDMFNKGEGGFLDRDLYVFCNNTADGTIVALGNPNAKKTTGHRRQEAEGLERKGVRSGNLCCRAEARRSNY